MTDKPKHYNWGLQSGWKCGICAEPLYTRFEREGEFPPYCETVKQQYVAWGYDGDNLEEAISNLERRCERVVHDLCGFTFCLTHGGGLAARRP